MNDRLLFQGVYLECVMTLLAAECMDVACSLGAMTNGDEKSTKYFAADSFLGSGLIARLGKKKKRLELGSLACY